MKLCIEIDFDESNRIAEEAELVRVLADIPTRLNLDDIRETGGYQLHDSEGQWVGTFEITR